MNPPRDWLVVGDVEGVGIETAVPADDIEDVEGVGVNRPGDSPRPWAAMFDVHLDFVVPARTNVFGVGRFGRRACPRYAIRNRRRVDWHPASHQYLPDGGGPIRGKKPRYIAGSPDDQRIERLVQGRGREVEPNS